MHCKQPIIHRVILGDTLYQLSRYYQTTVQSILDQNHNTDPNNLQIGSLLSICPGHGYFDQEYEQQKPAQSRLSQPFPLVGKMRKVWEQHVYWTRMLLLSIAERLKDLDDVTARLMQNPKDIANIFAKFYDEATAKVIDQLLSEHLQIGADLITALRDGKKQEADNLKHQWYKNADKMADAFSGINPYFDRDELRKMLYTHLDLTTQEVAMRLAGNYPADIQAFDRVEKEALAMADYFSFGIMRQFPDRFI